MNVKSGDTDNREGAAAREYWSRLFDEGFKPNWLNEFKRRNITVYGNIEPELGESVLRDYITQNRIVYKPKRD